MSYKLEKSRLNVRSGAHPDVSAMREKLEEGIGTTDVSFLGLCFSQEWEVT